MTHSSSMQFFHTTVWTFITTLFVFGAAVMIRGYLQIPPEISNSTQYETVIVCWVLLTLIPILGAGLGVVMPALDRVVLAEEKVAALDFKVFNEIQNENKKTQAGSQESYSQKDNI